MNAKKVVFPDDFSVAGSFNSIKDYCDKLTAIGPKYGYFPKPTKSYLIVKRKKLMEAQNEFAKSRVNITAEGKRNLDEVIESTEYHDEYVKDLVNSLFYFKMIGTTNLPFCQLLRKPNLKQLT